MQQTTSNDVVIATSNLQMRYGKKQVLDDLDLTISAQEVVAVLGPNGAGKSTTVEIFEGFRTPSAGFVTVLGVDPATAAEAWRSQVGVVLQESHDHGKWRPRQLLAHLSEYYRPYVDPWPVDELLDLVGLTEQAHQKIHTLSGGQRRRMDVAMGVIGRPPLLFLDEPTTGFDPAARRDFHQLIEQLIAIENTTIVLTTHDLAEAEKLASRILILAGGRIIADGTPLELMEAVSGTADIRWKHHGQSRAHTSQNATTFVRELLAAQGEAITDLEIRRNTLEDAYLSIVAQVEAGETVGITEFEEAPGS